MKNFFRNHDNTIDPYDSIPLQPPTISTAGEATHQFSRVHVEGKVREREREKKKARQEELEANIDTKRGYKRRRERERERKENYIYLQRPSGRSQHAPEGMHKSNYSIRSTLFSLRCFYFVCINVVLSFSISCL